MHSITAFLTSLTSQELLQAALDKEPGVLHGWLLLREFLKLPGTTSGRSSFDRRKVHQDQQTNIYQPTKLSHPFEVVSEGMALLLVGRVPGTSNRRSWMASHHPSL
jgi:hypothetical protein